MIITEVVKDKMFNKEKYTTPPQTAGYWNSSQILTPQGAGH
jgi:hypothetical protein